MKSFRLPVTVVNRAETLGQKQVPVALMGGAPAVVECTQVQAVAKGMGPETSIEIGISTLNEKLSHFLRLGDQFMLVMIAGEGTEEDEVTEGDMALLAEGKPVSKDRRFRS